MPRGGAGPRWRWSASCACGDPAAGRRGGGPLRSGGRGPRPCETCAGPRSRGSAGCSAAGSSPSASTRRGSAGDGWRRSPGARSPRRAAGRRAPRAGTSSSPSRRAGCRWRSSACAGGLGLWPAPTRPRRPGRPPTRRATPGRAWRRPAPGPGRGSRRASRRWPTRRTSGWCQRARGAPRMQQRTGPPTTSGERTGPGKQKVKSRRV